MVTMSDDSSGEMDAAAERLYAVAGRCINGWAFVDQALFDIFRVALGTDLVKASIVYYRSPSFSDHLFLVDRIISVTLAKGTQERADWVVLKKRIDTLLPIRNRIAHHPTTVFSRQVMTPRQDVTGWSHRHEHWPAYVEESRKLAHLSERERYGQIAKTQIRETDLVAHHNATVDLHNDLQSYLERAADALGKPAPEPPWPETPPARDQSR